MTTIKFKMMKSFLKWMSGTVLTVMLLMALPVQQARAQGDYVSYQTFYDDLSPYGQWVYDPDYGNVWVPDAGPDFRPYYSNGQWVMTEYGNTWVSNYNWGWAPFHYGRWTYNPFYGWVWIPGNTWGPAWVSWRWGGGNCGWAPLGPGISLSVSIGNYYCPNDWWVFVGPQYLYQPNYGRYWRGPRYNNTYINNTTIINNTYNNTYVYGPRGNDIERVTHQRVNVHRVGNGPRGQTVVNNNTVNIYRPNVRGNGSDTRPRNVVEAPRSIGKPQSVRNTRPEFKEMVNRGEVRQVNPRDGGREQRFDGRPDARQDRVSPRPMDNRQNTVSPRDRRDQVQQRVEREQPQQRVERPQPQQRVERPQPQQRMERPQPQQRMERPQPQQRMERPQPQQRMERPQPQQRMERPQPQQRMERPQPQQRMERPQPQQRMERPQPQQRMERPQPAPRPERQQSRPTENRGGGRR